MRKHDSPLGATGVTRLSQYADEDELVGPSDPSVSGSPARMSSMRAKSVRIFWRAALYGSQSWTVRGVPYATLRHRSSSPICGRECA